MSSDVARPEPIKISAVWFNISLFNVKVTAHNGMVVNHEQVMK
jgi:hypothetical protein